MLNFEVDNCSMAITLLYDLELCDDNTDEYGLQAIGRGPIWLKVVISLWFIQRIYDLSQGGCYHILRKWSCALKSPHQA